MIASDKEFEKLSEYRERIDSLNAISSYEVYRWLISLGKKLKNHPLSEKNRIVRRL